MTSFRPIFFKPGAGRLAVLGLVALLLAAAPALGQAPTGDEKLKEAQSVLLMLGLSTAKPTGVMNPATDRAIGDFQRVSGLPVTNKLDAATLEALRAKRDTKFGNELHVPTAAEKKASAAAAREPLPAPAAVGPARPVDAVAGEGGHELLTTRSLGSLPALSAPQIALPPGAQSPAAKPGAGAPRVSGLAPPPLKTQAPAPIQTGPLTLPPGANAPLPVTADEPPDEAEASTGPATWVVILAWVGLPTGLFALVWLGWPIFGRRLDAELASPTVSAGLLNRSEPAFSGARMMTPSDPSLYDY